MDSDEVRRRWAERSGEFSPAYYAYYGPNETSETVGRLLERFLDPEASVLELGCSSGRHLAHLRERGFEDLAGIEINEGALEVMRRTYPDLAADGSFYIDAIEDAVVDFEDGRFDAVFSVETIQHLHPDVDWVFEELSRITDRLLVTAETEGDGEGSPGSDPTVNYVDDGVPLYYRDWRRVFTDVGFVELDARPGARETVRAFRSPRSGPLA